MKVAVIGASGFLGQAVVERLLQHEACSTRAVIHSSGNAWALVSAGIPVHFANLQVPESIKKALEGCTHVVNCSRGGEQLMKEGLANLLRESREAGIERFIHISSVAIYGSGAQTSELSEDAPLRPDTDYGVLKLTQDEQVIKARDKGLDTVILCPPNIGGAGSPFIGEVYASLVQQRFAFVEQGNQSLELVDVHNLANAVWLALNCRHAKRDRYFITDCEPVTWAELVEQLEKHFAISFAPPSVSEQEITPASSSSDAHAKRHSVIKAIKHVVSSDVREALRHDPLWTKFDKWLRRLVSKLPLSLEDKVRLSIEGTLSVPPPDYWPEIDKRLCEQQLKSVQYSCIHAAEDLGYKPHISFERSVDAFSRWRMADCGLVKNHADLFLELER